MRPFMHSNNYKLRALPAQKACNIQSKEYIQTSIIIQTIVPTSHKAYNENSSDISDEEARNHVVRHFKTVLQ